MAQIYIFLCALTLLLFLLTRTVWVKIIIYGEFILEIHFSIIALRISMAKKESANKKRSAKKRKSQSPAFYILLFRRIRQLIRHSDINVDRLSIGDGKATVKHGGLAWGRSIFLAYIASESQKLTVSDNAFILIPDDSAFKFDITSRLSVARFIALTAATVFDLFKAKYFKRIS